MDGNSNGNNNLITTNSNIESIIIKKSTYHNYKVKSETGFEKEWIKCYPNPTTGTVNLFSQYQLIDRLEIYSSVGKKQLEYKFIKLENAQQIEINDLTPDIYF